MIQIYPVQNELNRACKSDIVFSNISLSLIAFGILKKYFSRICPNYAAYFNSRSSLHLRFLFLFPKKKALRQSVPNSFCILEFLLSHRHTYLFFLKCACEHAVFPHCTAQKVMHLVNTLYQMPVNPLQPDVGYVPLGYIIPNRSCHKTCSLKIC